MTGSAGPPSWRFGVYLVVMQTGHRYDPVEFLGNPNLLEEIVHPEDRLIFSKINSKIDGMA
jgi:hypothetical protein